MSILRFTMLALGGVASLATAITPAAAAPHGWRHGPRYGGYHRHHGGSGVGGAIVGGLLIGGVVAAIASADDDDDAPPPQQQAYAPPPPAAGIDQAPPAGAYAERTQGMAVDLCSEAAEQESAPSARVNAITRVERDGQAAAGWRVDGVIDTGRTAMNGYRELSRFTCAVDGDRVVDLRFGADEGPLALR